MSIDKRAAGLLFLVCLGLAACLEKPRATIPITTSSDAAMKSFLEGRALLDGLRSSEARRHFRQAVEQDPDFALAHFSLANSASTAKEFFDSLKRAVALAGSVSEGERKMILGFDAGVKGNLERQLELYKEMILLYPDDERARMTLGTFYFGQRKYAPARECLEMAIDLNPKYSPAYNLLGYASRFLKDFEQAEVAFRNYIDLVPSEPNPYDSYAELLMKMGRFEESIENYQKALSYDPGFAPSLVGVGNNLIFLGRADEAREQFRKLHEIARDDGERRQALFWIAASHVHEGNHALALEELGRSLAIAQDGDDPASAAQDQILMGDILLDSGDTEGGLAAYTASLEIMDGADVPEEVRSAAQRDHLYRQARTALAAGDIETAMTRTEQYGQATAQSQVPLERRRLSELEGSLAMAQGKYEEAVRMLVKTDKQNPRILYLAAVAADRAGFEKRAHRFAVRARDFNGLGFDYAFVRTKAQAMSPTDATKR